jgi:hypothetical protein
VYSPACPITLLHKKSAEENVDDAIPEKILQYSTRAHRQQRKGLETGALIALTANSTLAYGGRKGTADKWGQEKKVFQTK